MDPFCAQSKLLLKGELEYRVLFGDLVLSNLTRLDLNIVKKKS